MRMLRRRQNAVPPLQNFDSLRETTFHYQLDVHSIVNYERKIRFDLLGMSINLLFLHFLGKVWRIRAPTQLQIIFLS